MRTFSALTGQAMRLKHLPHLWEEAIVREHFVLLGPRTQGSVHVLVPQAVPSITMNEVHAGERAFVLNASMALHEDNEEELGDFGCG
jgi:hypothetical protein